MSGQTNSMKGKLLYFLLTDDYGVGESQCKIERLVQCAPIPQHRQRDAKDAVDEMLRSTDVPLYSKGGGSRKVVQIVPSKLERARELANEWHPERSVGETFDRTDLSDGDERAEVVVSLPYDHQGAAWNLLESAAPDFDHRHGAESDVSPADHVEFDLRGERDEVESVVERLVDATSGDLRRHDESASKEALAA